MWLELNDLQKRMIRVVLEVVTTKQSDIGRIAVGFSIAENQRRRTGRWEQKTFIDYQRPLIDVCVIELTILESDKKSPQIVGLRPPMEMTSSATSGRLQIALIPLAPLPTSAPGNILSLDYLGKCNFKSYHHVGLTLNSHYITAKIYATSYFRSAANRIDTTMFHHIFPPWLNFWPPSEWS